MGKRKETAFVIVQCNSALFIAGLQFLSQPSVRAFFGYCNMEPLHFSPEGGGVDAKLGGSALAAPAIIPKCL
jgi:hypothetical protein